MTEMGELLVGAWLKEIKNCDFIQYDARLPEGHLPGLNEVDVIGLELKNKIAYLCEVTTHVRGALYGTYQKTLDKIRVKFERDKVFADKILKDFPARHYMFWSPVVPKGKLTLKLKELEGHDVELVVNEKYAERIEELRKVAREKKNDTGNDAFRLLQILAHVRTQKPRVNINQLPTPENGQGGFKAYRPGRSCIQLGKEHQYVRHVSRKGGVYLKCTECGSSSTVARGATSNEPV